MSLFGSLHVGTSGLQTSQNALNTTAHNLSNIDTTGYTRQQILLATRGYTTLSVNPNSVSNQQVGLGVYYAKVRQVRDNFLDQTYRRETGRSAFYEVSANTIEEMETLFGELEGASFSKSMDALWTSIQELAKDPTASVGQGLLVNKASSFLERAQAVYEGLNDYQDNLNLQIKGQVDKINNYAKQIKELNDRIVKIESGVEEANDLRDARNQLLDELSAIVKIDYTEDALGNVNIKAEGEDLLQNGRVYEMDVYTDEKTGFHTPYWKSNAKYAADGTLLSGSEVFNLKLEISTEKQTDVGSLKAMLLARGNKRGNYTDLDDVDVYKRDIQPSIVVNAQAEFDRLIHSVATGLNEAIASAADPATGYLCEKDVNGNNIPLQLFTKKSTDGYNTAYAGAADPEGRQYDADGYMIEDFDDFGTLYTVSNLNINSTLMQAPTKLDMIRPDGKADFDLAKAVKEVFTDDSHHLNPVVKSPCTLNEFYSSLISQMANNGYVYRGMQADQEQLVQQTEAARQQIMGVSSDEELTNMIKFQNAYNAASRYINVISEMLEHVINTLGS